MRQERILKLFAAIVVMVCVAVVMAFANTSTGNLNFTNTALLRPDGSSEPELRVRADGTVGMVALSWENFVTHLWSAPFGGTATFRGEVDAALQITGQRQVFGGGDADVDLGSTGTLHATTLIFITPPTLTTAQLGVSAITCTGFTLSAPNIPADCKSQIIDTAGADRSWITSDGSRVFISYHDAGNSTLIHVQRSDDDGFTWTKVGDPVVAQGSNTGNATFNNDQGPIVADSFTHNVYDVYAAGQAGIQKATSANFNNILVSRSTDGGQTWTATLVYHAPLFTSLNNVFPSLAADPMNGNLYAVWSDAHSVFFSSSSDEGSTWSPAVAVSIAPAKTALFPWVAAYNGTVDVVYYGTTASSKDDPSATWFTYIAQTTDGVNFTQSRVNNKTNHVGVICTGGISCQPGTRNLLDLFQVAIDPQNGKSAIIYTDDTLTKDSLGNPLPQVVLAEQK
jgi:hypothetical protein